MDLGLLVRTLVVFATKQSRFRTVASIPLETMQDSWEKAKRGIRFAINFLRANAHIEDESLLSSPFLIIPIAVFFVLREGQIRSGEERDLLLWLFVANAKGHYSTSSETVLDADLGALFRGGSPRELLELLRQQQGRERFSPADFAGRSSRNPVFSLTYLALKHAGAKDWLSGLNISLTNQGKLHYVQHHHIFPKAVLKGAGYESGEINEIANLAFVAGGLNRSLGSKPPATYFPGVIEARGQEALASQCIPLSQDLWEVANFRQFLEWRRAELARTVNSFLDQIESDEVAYDLEEMVSAGENELVEYKSSARYNSHTGGVDRVLEMTIVKGIVGFLNSRGGTLLIGVNDAGLAVGISHDLGTLGKKNEDGYELFLTALIDAHIGIERKPQVTVSFDSLDSKVICVVRVAPSPKPVYAKDGDRLTFFVRLGNSSHPLNMEEAVTYIGEHWS